MVLLAWGVNYQTAPLKIREKLAVSKDRAELLLQAIFQENIANEAVIVSTCNRTELYCEVNQVEALLDWITRFFKLKSHDITPYIYTYQEEAAALHLMRVACGLNSMILGEVEILGQIKQAFHLAKANNTLGKTLHRLFQSTFAVAKMVRSKTDIGVNPVSVASTAVRLAERIFRNLQDTNILLLGAGDLIRLTAIHLKQAGVDKLLVANRSRPRLEKLAKTIAAEALTLEEVPFRLHEVDIVISGTSSPLPLIGKGMVEEALEKRKRRPMLMIDLAVPRDIEPQVGLLEDIYLYCIDDLKIIVEENRKLRQSAAFTAENIIVKECENFIQWVRAQDALDTLKNFRNKFEQMSEELLVEANLQLKRGKTPEEVLKRYSALLFKRLMHAPTSRLRKAGYQGEASILQFTRELFELNHEIINT